MCGIPATTGYLEVMSTRCAMVGGVVVAIVAECAGAQAINFDLWLAGTTPSDNYGGGAGQAGVWNAAGKFPFADVDGNLTSIYLSPNGGGSATVHVPGASPDDAALMDDFYSLQDSNYLAVGNLSEGKYRVYVYMWQGAIEQKSGYTDCRVIVQGNTPSNTLLSTTYTKDWPGQQVYKTTYDYVDIQISGSATIFFTPGFKDFCILQGFQLVPIPGPSSLALLAPLGLAATRRRRR